MLQGIIVLFVCSETMTDFGPIGKFQILNTLGSGANSTILHIRRSADSKQYALKVVPITNKDDQKFLVQARHEFRIAQMFHHPNLIKIHALETPRDWLFRIKNVHMLIEFVNGQTLDKHKAMPLPRLVDVFERVASGLVHMHRRGVFHADLKPNNIMLSKTGDVKIIDYGLAWIKGEPKDRVQGTPEYMAPEQSQRSQVNEKTDIYNFGATMYRMVTWRLPPNTMTSGDEMRIGAKLFETMLKPVGELNPKTPEPLCTLIHQCLKFHANQRPERMSEVQDRLKGMAKKLIKSPEQGLQGMAWE